MTLYQTQPDRKLRAKALAKEYGIGGHSHDFLDGSRGFVNHDWKGLEFDHYPDHQKITLKWAQVEKYIDLMIQSDRYLTDEEKEQRATRQEASNYNVGDEVVVDLPTRTIEGAIGYVGETDVRIDTSAHGQSWDNEVINKQQFEQGCDRVRLLSVWIKCWRRQKPSPRNPKCLNTNVSLSEKSLTVKCRFLLSGMIFMMTTMKPITPFHSFLTRSRQNLIWKI